MSRSIQAGDLGGPLSEFYHRHLGIVNASGSDMNVRIYNDKHVLWSSMITDQSRLTLDIVLNLDDWSISFEPVNKPPLELPALTDPLEIMLAAREWMIDRVGIDDPEYRRIVDAIDRFERESHDPSLEYDYDDDT